MVAIGEAERTKPTDGVEDGGPRVSGDEVRPARVREGIDLVYGHAGVLMDVWEVVRELETLQLIGCEEANVLIAEGGVGVTARGSEDAGSEAVVHVLAEDAVDGGERDSGVAEGGDEA